MSRESASQRDTGRPSLLARVSRRLARDPRRHAGREGARHAAAYNDARIRELGLRYRSLR